MTRFNSHAATACGLERESMQRQLLAVFATLAFFAAAATVTHAQTFSVVYNFGSQAGDPIQPFYSGIIAQGRDGNLYSTTSSGGGPSFAGAAYKLTPSGLLTTLYDFGSVTGDGFSGFGGLTLGTDGNYYGTTYGGGFASFGTIFKMTAGGGLTTLYTFTNGADGSLPTAPPIQGTDGNYYGTTCPGCNNQGGYGSIYKISPAGAFTLLYAFDITHGMDAEGPLVQGTDGNFYGAAAYGGTNGYGVFFKITSAGKLTVLYNFDNTHGAYPIGPLIQGTDGNFYGTSLSGGISGCGVVFKLTATGKLTVLHNMNGTTDGYAPFAGLVQATDGNFYGANVYGGAASSGCPSGCGTLFKVTKTGTFATLYNFDMMTGELPYSTLIQHTNGMLYGGTQFGGTGIVDPSCVGGNCGVIYSLNINAAPFVSVLSTTAKVGKTVEILGQGFTGTTAVAFDGIAATFKATSNTFLTATVPAGALTGPVTVTTPSGKLTSNKTFRVTPQITNFSPPSGVVGTPVTINGVSLTQTSKVTFGGVAATTFSVTNDNLVTANVPTGAKTGKIVITTPGGAATSATNFTVTP
jgi:uncharacterized repeat protein (TIGR03803 family)